MFKKINIKILAIIEAVALAALVILFVTQSSTSEKTCKVTIGGKNNPCKCTERLER